MKLTRPLACVAASLAASFAAALTTPASAQESVTLDFSDPYAGVFNTFVDAIDGGPTTVTAPLALGRLETLTLTGATANPAGGQLVVRNGVLGVQSDPTGSPSPFVDELTNDLLTLSFNFDGTLTGIDLEGLNFRTFGIGGLAYNVANLDAPAGSVDLVGPYFGSGASGPNGETQTQPDQSVTGLSLDFSAGDQIQFFETNAGGSLTASLQIQSLTVTVIPAPATGALLALAAGLLITPRRPRSA